MVRVEEMERQVSLVQDRVESNRIALQRHGYLRRGSDRFARSSAERERSERPEPAPESHYQQAREHSGYQADPSMQQRMDQRGVGRIPLSNQQSGRIESQDDPSQGQLDYDPAASSQGSDEAEQEPLVITNADLEARYGPSVSSSRRASSERSETSSSESSGSSPHAPVTSERLPTSDELAEQEDSQASDQADEPSSSQGALADASSEEMLEHYQDSLAQYRAGDYGEALIGFTSFLEAGPRADYVDNALYWIGECHYGLGEFDASVEHFQRIIDELPRADKVPDAMLKMSLAFEQMGKSTEALELLEELVEQYPNSNPGRLGQERLDEYNQDDS